MISEHFVRITIGRMARRRDRMTTDLLCRRKHWVKRLWIFLNLIRNNLRCTRFYCQYKRIVYITHFGRLENTHWKLTGKFRLIKHGWDGFTEEKKRSYASHHGFLVFKYFIFRQNLYNDRPAIDWRTKHTVEGIVRKAQFEETRGSFSNILIYFLLVSYCNNDGQTGWRVNNWKKLNKRLRTTINQHGSLNFSFVYVEKNILNECFPSNCRLRL